MKLDSNTIRELVEVLRRDMEDERNRRSILFLALGNDVPVLQQITWSGSVATFIPDMVCKLADYGEVAPGRQALWALLEYVRSQAGVDVAQRIDELRPLIDLRSQSSALTDTSSSVETPDIDVLVQKVRSRLYDKIQFDCGKMQLLNRQVPIDNLYTDVYILEDVPHQHFVDISERVRGFDPTADDFERFYLGKVCYERVPGLEVVKDRCKLMCLGAPGSGKTTYLYYVATQCNEGKLQPKQVPVFIRLLRFADKIRNQPKLSLLDYLDNLLGTEDARQPPETEALLRQGRVLILLDGLDEVPQADSKSILNCIREFCETYHKNSIIITCRSNALDYSFRNLGFTEVMVADFNFEQIEIFANKWFVAVAKNNLEAGLVRSKQFLEKLELPENKRIRDLAITPILLNLTCLVFEDMRGNFPSNRANLYQRGLDILLKKWDEERGIQRDEVYEGLSLAVRKALLNQVAAATFEKNRYFFEQEEIEAYIADFLRNLFQSKNDKLQQDSAVILKSIEVQHGLLVERAQKVFSFSHLTFQEYFTAKNFVDSSDPQAWENLASHISQKRWREVFLLASSLMPNANNLLCLMKQQIDILVATDERLQQYLAWVDRKSLSVRTLYKKTVIRAFYLALAFARPRSVDYTSAFGRIISLARASEFARVPNFARALDLELEFDFNLACNLDLNLARGRQIDIDLDLDPKLKQALQQLKDQLPDPDEDLQKFEEWWQANAQVWTKQLRELMIEYHNIGHDWQFSEEQKKLLQQYYDANQLLVDCLNSDCIASDRVREEIEETLLLPIAEIQNRRGTRAEL